MKTKRKKNSRARSPSLRERANARDEATLLAEIELPDDEVLELWRLPNGGIVGVDHSFLEQFDGSIQDPYNEGNRYLFPDVDDSTAPVATPFIKCSLCDGYANKEKAHLHQNDWVCDERCWDERLRSSE